MRRVVTVFVGIMIIFFLFILFFDYTNNRYERKIVEKIKNNTQIKDIEYVNLYDKYYIVMDSNYLYIFDKKYVEVLRIDKMLLHKNSDNCDIIYDSGKVMYVTDRYKKGKLTYIYYDLYTYEKINEVVMGA